MLARFASVALKNTKLVSNTIRTPVRSFANDSLGEKGKSEENMYFRKKNRKFFCISNLEKKVESLMAKIQAQLEDGIQDVDLDDVLEDREWLAVIFFSIIF